VSDQDHWLWRLSDHDWLDAARRELEQAREHLGTRRTAITHARRAAGMALNGVLVGMAARGWTRSHCESAWGRSYMDHLRAVADSALAPMFDFEQAERCRTLLAIPVMPPTGLIRLATRKDEAASQAVGLAGAIVEACAEAIGRPQNQPDPTKPGV
jgi:hypothetical protein